MNAFKLTILQYLISAFVSQLNEETVKHALAAAIAQARKVIQGTETEMDDFILLPMLEAIENALKLK